MGFLDCFSVLGNDVFNDLSDGDLVGVGDVVRFLKESEYEYQFE